MLTCRFKKACVYIQIKKSIIFQAYIFNSSGLVKVSRIHFTFKFNCSPFEFHNSKKFPKMFHSNV